MRKCLWIIAFLVFVPSLKADSFQVTSGFFQPFGGTTNDNISLSGDGFTATGYIDIGPGACFANYQPGQPITGCAGQNWVGGFITITHNGVKEQVGYGFDWRIGISQADMFLSGATQATLSESAMFGGLTGCVDEGHFPNCAPTTLIFPRDVLFTISLTQNPFFGGYDVTSEKYTFSIPEPSTIGLILVGMIFLLVMRKNIVQGLQQGT